MPEGTPAAAPPAPGVARATPAHAAPAPSAWVLRFAPLARAGGHWLDVACGHGRHTLTLLQRGFAVTAVDRDAAALQALRETAQAAGAGARLHALDADLEGAPWPLGGRRFDGVVVTNYLWRPLWPALRVALAPGGVLVYETFALGQHTIGRPARPEFLLQPGELLQRCAGLRVVAYEDGFEPERGGRPARFVQRIAAVDEGTAADPTARGTTWPRHGLDGAAG
jgi:SAM-dependent methyltransferase